MSKKDTENAKTQEDKLPPHWERLHGAIWLIGLAFLFWSGHFFPGILILAGISGIAHAAMLAYVKQHQATDTLAIEREAHLPENCPNCGGPLNAAKVRWQGKQSALCPYCGSTVKATANPATANSSSTNSAKAKTAA